MTGYVAGFLFDDCMEYVALVRKLKPRWQNGRLNAIGGKIEYEESPDDAMHREFQEETGMGIVPWKPLCVLRGANWVVHFYYQVAEYSTLAALKSMEAEQIEIHKASYFKEMLPNLEWLIPMAKSLHRGEDRAASFEIFEEYPEYAA